MTIDGDTTGVARAQAPATPARDFCLRCRRPRSSCLCPAEPPLEVRTKFVLLMHPKELKKTKCTTGRLACLNIAGSEILYGVGFDEHPRVRALLNDSALFPVLLYPGEGAIDVSSRSFSLALPAGSRLLVFLIDATWACSRSVLRQSPGIGRLPRIMLTPRERSRWLIKRQPADNFLSTLESVHELLLNLEEAGLDRYTDKGRLLDVFARMQEYQIERARASGHSIA